MKTYECEVITPMFAHGADPTKFELRAPSVKGAMRFWFRTALGSKLKMNIKAIKKAESYIFGDTSRKSKIMLSVDNSLNATSKALNSNIFISVNLGKKIIKLDAIKYLAYGLYDSPKSREWHEYLRKGKFKVNVSIFSKSKAENEKLFSLTDDLLHLMSLFGGLGAKTTRGFGSFSIDGFPKSITNKDIQTLTSKLIENIYANSKELMKDVNFEPVEFTSIPTYPIIDLNEKSMGVMKLNSKDAINALAEVGKKYYEFRRKVENDGAFHSNYKDQKYKAKRAMLGLPILYQTPRPVLTLNNEFGRKASPLRLTIHKNENAYYLVYVFLPSAVGKNNILNVLSNNKNSKSVTVESDFHKLEDDFKEVMEGRNK